MEYKEPTEDLKPFVERAQAFWDQVDVEAMKPIIHGDLPSEEAMKERAQALAKAEELMKQYNEMLSAKKKEDAEYEMRQK